MVKSKELLRHSKIETIVTDQRSDQKFKHSRLTPINHSNLISEPLQRPGPLLKRSKPLSLAVINTRSLNVNGFKLKDSIVDLDSNFVVITESWQPQHYSVANHIIKNTFPTGFKMVRQPRGSDQRGGGVAIMFGKELSIKPSTSPSDTQFFSFEYMEQLHETTWIRLVNVYHPLKRTVQERTPHIITCRNPFVTPRLLSKKREKTSSFARKNKRQHVIAKSGWWSCQVSK